MEFVLYEQKGQYAIITINREKALNALSTAVLKDLENHKEKVIINLASNEYYKSIKKIEKKVRVITPVFKE